MKKSQQLLLFVVVVLIALIIMLPYVIEGLKKEKQEIILATTTSTENSGLLDYLLPYFTEETGITVKVVAVGTGKAFEMGKNAEADVLLVHAKEQELEFVAEGYGTSRTDVMYNDFILIGPSESELVNQEGLKDCAKAMLTIYQSGSVFVSRGDESGTHIKELSLWELVQIQPEGDRYVSSGKGMGETITMTDELQAYTLCDRATYLAMKDSIDLAIIVEGDTNLFNQYGVIPVDPELSEHINEKGAKEFVQWIVSDEAQDLIKNFGVDEYGEPLFIPNAK